MNLGLMIDLETVGMKYNAGLAQIGSVIYNEDTFEIVSEFCQNINWRKMVKSGLFVREEHVLEWWRKQEKAVIKSVFENALDPKDVATDYLKWVKEVTGGRHFTLMSNHILFDITKADYYLNTMVGENLSDLTLYNKIEDFATIRNKAKWLDPELLEEIEDEFEDNSTHNALTDCKWQLHSLEACMGIMAGSSEG